MGWKELENPVNDHAIDEEYEPDDDYDDYGDDDGDNENDCLPEVLSMNDELFITGSAGTDIPMTFTFENITKWFRDSKLEFNLSGYVSFIKHTLAELVNSKTLDLHLCRFSSAVDKEHPCNYCPVNLFASYYNATLPEEELSEGCCETVYNPHAQVLLKHLLIVLEKEAYISSEELI